MSYIYLQEQGEESSAESFSDIPPSVLSRLNLTAEKSSCSGSATESCPNSPSGMMLRRLTGFRGETWLTWYVADSPVRTYLPPVKEPGFVESEAGCGPSSPESLAKFNPDLYGWKTRQCSLFGGLQWYAETWPRWGMMRAGELFLLPTPAEIIYAREFGSKELNGGGGQWPTPCLPNNGGSHGKSKLKAMIPTPRVSMAEGSTGGGHQGSRPANTR